MGKIQMHYLVQGLASPTIVNDILYINHQYANMVEALRAGDGVHLWSYEVNGKICLSPIVVADVVYVSTEEGDVYALQATDGTLLWQHKVSPMLFAPPTVTGDAAYISSLGYSSPQSFVPISSSAQPSSHSSVDALHSGDGRLLWRSPISASTSFPLTVRDGVIYPHVIVLSSGNTR